MLRLAVYTRELYAYADEPRRIAEESSLVVWKKKNRKVMASTAGTKGARLSSAWTFDDHRALTLRPSSFYSFSFSSFTGTRPLCSALSISRFRRELHGPAVAVTMINRRTFVSR